MSLTICSSGVTLPADLGTSSWARGDNAERLVRRALAHGRNVKRADMRFDCGFTVDGELEMPDPGCVASLTADESVSFVRA